jgi:CDGSH-type Zn-finger protein/truncated hemoglobin YjbI
MMEANPAFDPVRPVIAANVRPPERDVEVPLISDPLTARVTDLFNVAYEILLQMFERYFAHTEETDAQLKILADATLGLMLRVIKPLGDLITTLPVGSGQPGRNVGPSFELFYESDYLMPHREAAWALLTERLDEASWLCEALQEGRGTGVADRLRPVLAAMQEIAATLAAQLPAGSAQAREALRARPLSAAERAALLARARDLATATPRDTDASDGLDGLFNAVCSMVLVADSPLLTGAAGGVLARLVDSVLRPLADALARSRTPDSAAAAGQGQPATGECQQSAPGGDLPEQTADELVWRVAEMATRLLVRLAPAGMAPPELAEATAALQDLACQLPPADEQAGRLAHLREIQNGLPVVIQAAKDGPYLATNVPRLLNYLGEPVSATPQLALCRCGGSSMKPFCDGTHARIGFTDGKDPRRVLDRRDNYPGQQLVILDNRGICQHSGFCTDRLATVFRAGQEPFVAPSGGRMDEVIRAVRDCPSGALSFGVDGREAREQTDWGNRREAAIEITKDGPYRVTGGIAIIDADGKPADRNEGASHEHCALCRCGQSQNKPFCSGMHWYVDFRDPVPEPGSQPTLFEWAGGLPALNRMTGLLYDRHVPADPLLAPLFADSPPGESGRLAAWLGEVFGGPPYRSDDLGGYPLMIAQTPEPPPTEDQRARWAELISHAAQEAGLPADPGFRSAFMSYIEWDTRQATDNSHPGAPQRAQVPVPAWDWGPAGPPDLTAAPTVEVQAEQPELPGPDAPVSFTAHVKPLFRERDRQSMSFAFDLWSHDDVSARAQDILDRLQNGSMPCDGAWAAEKIQVFRRWAESGMQP